MSKYLGYMGAALMVAASFNMAADIGKLIAIVGLLALTLEQLTGNRQINLIMLNVFSVAGFTFSLLG
jgi:hypothetical protein